MKKNLSVAALLFSLFCFTNISNASDSMFLPMQAGFAGPLLSVHFVEEDIQISLGLEASYWVMFHEDMHVNGIPVLFGADLGVEYNFSAKKWVYYTEGQVGIALLGASFGAVFDREKGIGMQNSFWGNLLLGGMYRLRHFETMESVTDTATGVYLKVPYLIGTDPFWDF
jgi:hypothetical protein